LLFDPNIGKLQFRHEWEWLQTVLTAVIQRW